MKVFLVTGGAGFIGSHLVDKLLQMGHSVVVVDNFNDYYSPKQKEQNISGCLDNDKFYLYRIDFCDKEKLDEVFGCHKFDAIFHIGARAGVRRSWDEQTEYTKSNVLGTLNIFEMARVKGISKVIYASSSTVYGMYAPAPFKETLPLDRYPAASPYGASKRAVENIASMYAHIHGIKSVGLRLFSVYGERIRHDLAPWIFTDSIENGMPFPVLGDLDSRRDMTYVGDVVNAFVSAYANMENFKEMHEVFNIGNDRPEKLSKIVDLIESYLGKKGTPDYKPKHASDPKETWADISKAREVLEYNPETAVEEGIERLVQWYKQII